MNETRVIAVAADDDRGLVASVSPHFGRCRFYTFVEVDGDGRIVEARAVPNPYAEAHGPGVVPQFLADQGADVILAGGMGRRAVAAFIELGLAAATGASGKVEDALRAYLAGSLHGTEPCAESEDHHHADGNAGGQHGAGPGHGLGRRRGF